MTVSLRQRQGRRRPLLVGAWSSPGRWPSEPVVGGDARLTGVAGSCWDGAGRDAAGRDPVGRDTAGRDAAGRDRADGSTAPIPSGDLIDGAPRRAAPVGRLAPREKKGSGGAFAAGLVAAGALAAASFARRSAASGAPPAMSLGTAVAIGSGAMGPGTVGTSAAAAAAHEGAAPSASTGPALAGAVRILVDAGPPQSGSQNGSGNGASGGVGCGALAAAANRLKKAWLDARPDGSKDGSSSGTTGQGAGPLAVTGAEEVNSWRNSSRAARSSAAGGVPRPATGAVAWGDAWSVWPPISVRAQLHVPSRAPHLGHIAVTASPSWMSVLLRYPSVKRGRILMRGGKRDRSAKSQWTASELGARRDGQVSYGTRHDPLRAAAVRP